MALYVCLIIIQKLILMINLIKFSVIIVDGQNHPCAHLFINCKSLTDQTNANEMESANNADFQFFYNKLDAKEKAYFEFESHGKSIEVEIEVRGNFFRHTFRDGDEVIFKLFMYDDLNIFLELMTTENNLESVPAFF